MKPAVSVQLGEYLGITEASEEMVRGRENVPFALDGFVEPCEVTADAHAAVWFWHNDHAGTPIGRFGHWANDASVFHATEGFNKPSIPWAEQLAEEWRASMEEPHREVEWCGEDRRYLGPENRSGNSAATGERESEAEALEVEVVSRTLAGAGRMPSASNGWTSEQWKLEVADHVHLGGHGVRLR